MDENILDFIRTSSDSRRLFFQNLRLIDFRSRSAIITSYLRIESVEMDIISRIYTQQQTNDIANSIVRLTVPSRFLEPVRVTATQQQINNSIVVRETQESPCAICQEAISSDGVALRHCSHGYHRTCILSWFSTSVRCPVCRHDIRETGQANQTSSASV